MKKAVLSWQRWLLFILVILQLYTQVGCNVRHAYAYCVQPPGCPVAQQKKMLKQKTEIWDDAPLGQHKQPKKNPVISGTLWIDENSNCVLWTRSRCVAVSYVSILWTLTVKKNQKKKQCNEEIHANSCSDLAVWGRNRWHALKILFALWVSLKKYLSIIDNVTADCLIHRSHNQIGWLGHFSNFFFLDFWKVQLTVASVSEQSWIQEILHFAHVLCHSGFNANISN